jgi:hypothetical protein
MGTDCVVYAGNDEHGCTVSRGEFRTGMPSTAIEEILEQFSLASHFEDFYVFTFANLLGAVLAVQAIDSDFAHKLLAVCSFSGHETFDFYRIEFG